MSAKDIESDTASGRKRVALLRILDYEKNTDPVRDWPLGWS